MILAEPRVRTAFLTQITVEGGSASDVSLIIYMSQRSAYLCRRVKDGLRLTFIGATGKCLLHSEETEQCRCRSNFGVFGLM